MPASTVKNSTYRQLIGNGLTYRIPPFQRDYSWQDEQWEDLWADLLETVGPAGERAHYMGYLVLQSDDEKVFDVIDGQQRLTTLTLLVLAVLKQLSALVTNGTEADANRRRIEQLRQTYVGYLDPVTLLTRSKLTLNRNNDEYFQRYLVPLAQLPQRRLQVSVHLLRRAFEWFDQKVAASVQSQTEKDVGPALARLVEDMSDRLFFTVINVTDELNAYKVFETLNARGVKLSSTDLLKNYLFSILDREGEATDEMKALQQRWEDLVGRLGSERFPEFLRVHWLSRGKFVRHTDLFKAVRRDVANREAVFELLRKLDDDLDSYLALTTQPEASTFNAKMQSLVRDLRLFGVKQPLPLLMAALRSFSAAEFESLLRACVVLSFRYNVIGGLSPGEQEPVFADVARQIAEGHFTTSSAAIELLGRLYPSDESFIEAFNDKVFSKGKTKLIKYILVELEQQESLVPIDADDDSISIEHVLPQSPGPGWERFDSDALESMTWLVGNMVLLRRNQNSALGSTTWAQKRPVLEQSEFALTRKLAAENSEWTPARVQGRQRALAKLATARWRISQFRS